MQLFQSLKRLLRREIVLEIDEMDAEKLGFAALFRAAPKNNSRDWNLKTASRLQEALSAAQKCQSEEQIAAGVTPLSLMESEWKAVGRLCLALGEKPDNKWARNIANRIFADAIRRGKF